MKTLFCIESDWENKSRKEISILPLLECIKGVYPKFNYIYRTANTKDEIQYCLNKFKKISNIKDNFNVIVFCGHGDENKIQFGNNELTLTQLGEICSEVDENIFSNTVVHFFSCGLIKNEKKLDIESFGTLTNVSAITGFAKDVWFLESYALEMLLFEALLEPTDAKKVINEFYKKHKNGLCKFNDFGWWEF